MKFRFDIKLLILTLLEVKTSKLVRQLSTTITRVLPISERMLTTQTSVSRQNSIPTDENKELITYNKKLPVPVQKLPEFKPISKLISEKEIIANPHQNYTDSENMEKAVVVYKENLPLVLPSENTNLVKEPIKRKTRRSKRRGLIRKRRRKNKKESKEDENPDEPEESKEHDDYTEYDPENKENPQDNDWIDIGDLTTPQNQDISKMFKMISNIEDLKCEGEKVSYFNEFEYPSAPNPIFDTTEINKENVEPVTTVVEEKKSQQIDIKPKNGNENGYVRVQRKVRDIFYRNVRETSPTFRHLQSTKFEKPQEYQERKLIPTKKRKHLSLRHQSLQ